MKSRDTVIVPALERGSGVIREMAGEERKRVVRGRFRPESTQQVDVIIGCVSHSLRRQEGRRIAQPEC